jgi:hypothetical protein
MHLGGAGIGEADVNTARDQGPHQTFRTIHRSTPATFLECIEDQSFLAHFVKGFTGIAAIATAAVPFLTQHLKIAALTWPWLAKSRQLWPVSQANRF